MQFTAAISLIFLFFFQVSSSVIGIDYGSDWLKVSILKPGGAIETVLNRESKRKTNAVINIRNGIRTYGIEAVTLGMRFPQWTYGQLKNLLGKSFIDSATTTYNPSNPRKSSDRGTVVFKHNEGEEYSVEELVAMLLKHCKNQAEDYSGAKVSGAVITVPPHFTQFERQALMDAGDIADLRIFGLIHDETAVAINYVLGKKFDNPEFHMFYDMGAGSTVATLVSFQSGKTVLTKNNVDVIIKGYATDSVLGGRQVDIRIQQHLAAQFAKINNGKLSGDILKDNRAMARLMKEANRVKTILSANQNVEGLMDGIDFKLEVSRETLEKLCKDIFARSASTIESVLKSSNVTLDKIKSLVLFGGGARIPAVQKSISAFVGESKIARNVDGDEAAVLGAVLHGASLSPQYRLGQSFNIKDLAPRPIHVSYTAEKEGISKQEFHLFNSIASKNDVTVFPENSLLGSKKNVRFNRESDFDFEVAYQPIKGQREGTKIAKVVVTGLTDAFKKFEATRNDIPIVKVQIDLNESGLLQIKNPVAVFEVVVEDAEEEVEEKKGSSWSLFGGSKKEEKNGKDADSTADISKESTGEKSGSEGEKESDGNSGDKTEKAEKPEKAVKNKKDKSPKKKINYKIAPNGKKVKTEKVGLKFTVEWLTIAPLSEASKAAMRSRLVAFDAADKERFDLQAARNSLETFIYKCKELTYDDDFEDIASEEEQAALKDAASEASEWYEDNVESAARKDLIAKKNDLFKLGGPIFKRRREHSMRPAAVEDLESDIKLARGIYATFSEKLNDTDVSEIEFEKFQEVIQNVTSWLSEQVSLQTVLKNSADPVLTVQNLEEKRALLSKVVQHFNIKKRLKPKTNASGEKSKENDSDDKAPEFDPGMMDEETKRKLSDPKLSQEEMMKIIQESIAKGLKNKPPPAPENDKKGDSAAESSDQHDNSQKQGDDVVEGSDEL